MNKVKNILLWVFSIFMFLCGAVIIGEAVISALLMFAIGIISNPLFLKRVHTKRIINIIACVILFFASVMLFPGSNTNTKPITTQSTEETTTKEKTTEEESTKSKKELEESKKESSIAASKKAAKESSVAASKAEESRKAAEESSIAEASIQASIAESSAQASAAQFSIEQSQQASIVQSSVDQSQQASIVQSSIDQSQQASAAQAQGPMVWITATGEKYHNKPNCGNSNPATSRQISLQEAQSRGYQPCQKCY